ncbi:hypothetical protein SAMN06266787_1088 [Halorubrum ezzemoulense]|jgi:hypothetical protein|uniref:Uncharacterized protein n=1 Tax=Halorubrum ezzemoulense TaxID=337243 RepID=A0A238Y1U5_HALEZ|nr:hypothetical protein SAMN06266787_1088 [Halorubrum ezzemoulense]
MQAPSSYCFKGLASEEIFAGRTAEEISRLFGDCLTDFQRGGECAHFFEAMPKGPLVVIEPTVVLRPRRLTASRVSDTRAYGNPVD